MPRYRITEFVTVRIISEPLLAEDGLQAYRQYAHRTDLEQLLRNLQGSYSVANVEFADRRLSATVDELDENDDFARTAFTLGEDTLKSIFE